MPSQQPPINSEPVWPKGDSPLAIGPPGRPRLKMLLAGLLGAAWILLGFVAAGILAYARLSDQAPPGCGVQAACASLDTHPLGSLSGLARAAQDVYAGASVLDVIRAKNPVPKDQARWPTSLLGSAFYLGLLAGWTAMLARGWRRRDVLVVAWIVRLLAIWSMLFIAAIIIASKYCQYCLISHAANLLLLLTLEILVMPGTRVLGKRSKERFPWPLWGAGLASFAIAAAALGGMDSRRLEAARIKSEQAAAASRAEMMQAAERAKADAAAKAAQNPAAGTPPLEPVDPFGPKGFTGRWRLGPEKAVARIVVLSSYQCHQCRRIENEAVALVSKHPGKVSLSAKHYPFSNACNKYIGAANPHPNSCWAARASEAAAIIAASNAMLQGVEPWNASNEAFWKMHKWLFSQGGSFTDESFPKDLTALGYNPQQFITVMSGEQTLKLVQQDIDEGQLLGLSGTPMVFVNGIELKGWESPRALEQAVDALIAANPPAADASADRPVLAREKFVADWRDAQILRLAPGLNERTLGPADAKVSVVVFGDYIEPISVQVDRTLRDLLTAGKAPIKYTFRHFPADKDCNSMFDRTVYPQSCITARAAIAAGIVAGDDAFWKMHEWLMNNPNQAAIDNIVAQAGAMQIDPRKFSEMLTDAQTFGGAAAGAQVAQTLQHDIQTGQGLRLKSIPMVIINGKHVPRPTRDGDNVIERIILEAADDK